MQVFTPRKDKTSSVCRYSHPGEIKIAHVQTFTPIEDKQSSVCRCPHTPREDKGSSVCKYSHPGRPSSNRFLISALTLRGRMELGTSELLSRLSTTGTSCPCKHASLGARSDIIKLCTGPAKRYQTWRELGTPLQQGKAFYWLRPANHEEIQDIMEEHNQAYSTMRSQEASGCGK